MGAAQRKLGGGLIFALWRCPQEIEWRNFLPDFVSNRAEVEFLMEVTGHECTVKIEQLETLSI
jgi:hypothetical protein